ncbi:hypothetical protein ACHAWX_007165 [Stephanocyclus meneghinianus]
MLSAAIPLLLALSNALRVTGLRTNRRFAITFTPHRCRPPYPYNKPCHSSYHTASPSSTQLFTFENKKRVNVPSSLPPEVRHPLFLNTNAISRNLPVPHPEIWKQCFENTSRRNEVKDKSLWDLVAHNFLIRQHESPNKKIVTDVEVTFVDPSVGAQLLLEKCGLLSQQEMYNLFNGSRNKNIGDNIQQTAAILPEINMKEQQTLHHIATILSYYQSVVSPNNEKTTCRARIVSTLGSIGTKCPRWHADHVPVRLVMSLIGPGCEYIPYEMETMQDGQGTIHVVERDALNNLEEDDTSKANKMIVPSHTLEMAKQQSKKEIVICAKEGEAVLLMGRGWQEKDGGVLAAVHRSPRMTEGEERILLTVDVAYWDFD